MFWVIIPCYFRIDSGVIDRMKWFQMEDAIPQLCGIVKDDAESAVVNAVSSGGSGGAVLRDGVIVFPEDVQAAIDQVCIYKIVQG